MGVSYKYTRVNSIMKRQGLTIFNYICLDLVFLQLTQTISNFTRLWLKY